MKPVTVDLPPLSIRADVGTVNEEKRTVDLIFSTGAAVTRSDFWSGKQYREVLSLDPKHVRLERLNGGAPLLDGHAGWSVGDVLGTVEPDSARIEGGKAVATVRFSKRDSVEPIWQDVKDGILRSVSVGYRTYKYQEDTPKDGGIPTRTAIDWEPYEVSLVPMPADVGAKVRNGDKADTNPCVILTRAGADMDDVKETQTTPAQPAEASAAPAATETARAAEPTAEQIRQQEQARITGIQDAVRIAKLDAPLAADMVKRNLTLDQARAEIFAKLAERSEQTAVSNKVTVGQDAKDKWLRGATNWLLVRSGLAAMVAKHEGVELRTIDAGEFRGLSLLELAKDTLERAGRSYRGMDRMRLVGEAFMLRDGGMINQGTSDFATLLENAMYKVLQAAYATTPDTWRRFCATSSVVDFRTNPRYRMGNFSVLDSLNEQGEFKQKGISDAEKATIVVSTKGNIIAISRQAIVNDDVNFFSQVPARMGRAAALSIEVDVYALLAQNSGLGPSMPYDSTTLFHANHGNLTTGAALAAAALDLDRVAMASQKEPNGNDYIDLRPAVLVLPVGLGGQAKVINNSQYDPDTVANKSQMKPNLVAGLFRDIVDTPRISGTRRYLFADPAIAPVLEVAFLEGQQSPVLESQDGWRVDGAEMKVRFDYGVAAVDHRGAVTNAGV